MTVKVEPATMADIPAIAELQVDAFDSAYMQEVFPNSARGMAWTGGAWTRLVDPNHNWSGQPEPRVMVIRDEEGTVMSVASYFIIRSGQPYGVGSYEKRWLPSSGDPTSAKAKEGFFNTMAKNHEYIMEQREHIFLEVLMTSSAARKKGYGTALLNWGDALADEMGVEMYLDAEAEAKHLYEAHGYVQQDVTGAWDGEVPRGAATMRRPIKSTTA